ncbi:MAG: NAD(P)/FAD-dependent oxidoreductase [Bacteroidetes bacterium]|nr:NAD(P)/FAD-dependent oxidoreductase [Bacteroidota bacterium]
MTREFRLELSPEEAFQEEILHAVLRKKSAASDEEKIFIRKRSIDARSRQVKVLVQGLIIPQGVEPPQIKFTTNLPDVRNAQSVIIIGAGPAGLFAALKLIELGLRPVIIDRGKDVRARRRDIAAINKDHIVNPDSNYCFGEGGAGTYSDGKLYTRSVKRGDLQRILEILFVHGAREEVLYDAHPHIGTNKLPQIITAIRETILNAGGSVHFDQRVTDIIISGGQVCGVTTASGEKFESEHLVLATGHSARDVFELLDRKKILIEAKPFALGVRVEHAQQLIDKSQYHCETDRGPYLPAASYSLVHQAEIAGGKRGVFSFCMCPGGFIVPSSTQQDEVVVNGMSPSRRDSRYANSGIVVAVDQKDFKPFSKSGALAGMYFQAQVERKAHQTTGQHAPAQRLEDFIQNKFSSSLPETSYQPGLHASNLREVLPDFIAESLRLGFIDFGKKIKGYRSNDAVVVGVESRTSSPVRIPRDPVTLEHPQIQGLFPCGEGAGYAGGIVSAAMDGERIAEAVHHKVQKH